MKQISRFWNCYPICLKSQRWSFQVWYKFTTRMVVDLWWENNKWNYLQKPVRPAADSHPVRAVFREGKRAASQTKRAPKLWSVSARVEQVINLPEALQESALTSSNCHSHSRFSKRWFSNWHRKRETGAPEIVALILSVALELLTLVHGNMVLAGDVIAERAVVLFCTGTDCSTRMRNGRLRVQLYLQHLLEE